METSERVKTIFKNMKGLIMTLFVKGNMTRRRFVKNVAGTAVCCACLPLEVLADPERPSEHDKEERKKDEMTGPDKEHLVAACGTYCGACPAYIAKHCEDEQIIMKRQEIVSSGPKKALKGVPNPHWMDGLLCDGCLSGGTLPGHCQNCAIRKCAANKQSNSRCSDCEELPCHRITNLINMGHFLHRMEYLPNLEKIREMGVQEWVKYEEERWRCSQCGLPMSWYDTQCVRCGNPRSGRLFPLPNN
jgi:hypothetical protein